MRFLPVNSENILVELGSLQEALALLDALQYAPLEGIEEVIPAARTLLVRFRPAVLPRAELIRRLRQLEVRHAGTRHGALVEIPVRYDGEDLAEVAQLLGITPDEVVRRHTGSEYMVAFTGFAPGFAYLSGGDPVLDVPRRATPRTRIPAGSVALAGTFSGVYPHASPGGWQIIGTTDVPMWDLQRNPPALLRPGQRVRFVDLASRAALTPAVHVQDALPDSAVFPTGLESALEVRAAGLQTLIQDRGRLGQAGQGVSAAGAMDQAAFKMANRLVGNASDTPVLETLATGLRLRSHGDQVLAVTGAEVPLTLLQTDGKRVPAPMDAPVALADGDELLLGAPTRGVRCYVAVRGGLDAVSVLGSCATDTLAHVGPAPVQAGQWLPVHIARPGQAVGEPAIPADPLPAVGEVVTLDVTLGPRTDWFTAEAVALFERQEWEVTPQSNRVGLRLAGAQPLARAMTTELPSEGTPLGAIQVPASGQPVLFLADHPLTGGYPVIACVAIWHLDLAGQVPVGARIRFRVCAPFAEL